MSDYATAREMIAVAEVAGTHIALVVVGPPSKSSTIMWTGKGRENPLIARRLAQAALVVGAELDVETNDWTYPYFPGTPEEASPRFIGAPGGYAVMDHGPEEW